MKPGEGQAGRCPRHLSRKIVTEISRQISQEISRQLKKSTEKKKTIWIIERRSDFNGIAVV